MGLLATVEALPLETEQPDELVARVDGHDEAVLVLAVGPDEQRLDVGLERPDERVGGFDAAQVSSGSSDSVAPAGLG